MAGKRQLTVQSPRICSSPKRPQTTYQPENQEKRAVFPTLGVSMLRVVVSKKARLSGRLILLKLSVILPSAFQKILLMTSQIFQWKTPDGLWLHAMHWPVDQPLAVVCIVHGLGEHIGRYDHVATFFQKNNIATLGNDRRGHGRSEGSRGHTSGFGAFLDEVATLVEKAQEAYPGKPVFLYGHSMGGNLALSFLLEKKPDLRGVIATGPWIRLPKLPSGILVGFAKLMNHFAPGFSQSNGLDISGLSNDPAVVEAYVADPLVHNRITAATGVAMLKAAAHLDAFSGEIPVPLLLMHGAEDPITDPKGSEDFARRAAGDVTWKKWEGLKHEIHNEPQQAEVLSFLVRWIQQKL